MISNRPCRSSNTRSARPTLDDVSHANCFSGSLRNRSGYRHSNSCISRSTIVRSTSTPEFDNFSRNTGSAKAADEKTKAPRLGLESRRLSNSPPPELLIHKLQSPDLSGNSSNVPLGYVKVKCEVDYDRYRRAGVCGAGS